MKRVTVGSCISCLLGILPEDGNPQKCMSGGKSGSQLGAVLTPKGGSANAHDDKNIDRHCWDFARKQRNMQKEHS